jgi:hypothetical protein
MPLTGTARRDLIAPALRAALIALGIVISAGLCAAQDTDSVASTSLADGTAPVQLPSPKAPPAISSAASHVRRPWSALYYHSLMTDSNFWQVARGSVTLQYGYMDSIDISYEVAHENVFQLKAAEGSTLLTPFAGSLYLGGTLTRRGNDPKGTIFEIGPYIMWRTRNVPIGPLATRFSLGDGVSYVTRVPEREGGQPLLNFMIVEETLSLNSHRELEAVLRLHHRCPAWGLYGDGSSSNAIGLGIRVSF